MHKIIIAAYKEKQLTKKEFIDKMIAIRKLQFESVEFTNFIQCVFKNCYDINKKMLDNILLIFNDKKIKYKKPIKYTVKDYKKIMLLFIKHNDILPLANS